MASYQSDFDPPNRPGDLTRGKRLGTYMQAGPPKMERRGREIQVSSQTGTRRAQPSSSRTRPIGLPQGTLREPTAASTDFPELKAKAKTTTSSTFGFGKSDKATSRPELKGKSSRNVLRRKPSSVAQQQNAAARPPTERSVASGAIKSVPVPPERRPSMGTSSKSTDAYNEIFTRPARARTPAAKETPRVIPELDRYRARPEQATLSKIRSNGEVPKLATHDLPPPTPLLSGTPGNSGVSSSSHSHRYSGYSGSGYSASPSTRFSESPGPGAAYSRDTTPTSMSSQSPGLYAPMKLNPARLRHGSPAVNRPPPARRAAGSVSEPEDPVVAVESLPSLRESLTSSSSNSTVKGDGKGSEKKKKKKRLTPPPPSPPPRKSSQKLKKPSEDTLGTPSKSSQSPAKFIMSSPSEPSEKQITAPVQSPTKDNRPVRPSREGAPDLQAQLGDSMAIIQSNLAGFSFQTDRRQSGQRHVPFSTLQSQQVMRPGPGSRLPSRNPSPSPILPSPREATPAPSGLGIIPDLQSRNQSRGPATRTPSPSVGAPKARFALFGKRTKTAPEVPVLENKDKGLRKGPAAGTGHEGYGRHALRGRSSSTGAGAMGRDRSQSRGSRASTGSTHAPDPFLLERMSPVIISGGGEIKENRNASFEHLSRTDSNTSFIPPRPSLDSRNSSKSSLVKESRTTLWPSAMPKEPAKKPVRFPLPKGRRPSDSSDDGGASHTLAFRRSLLRLNASDSSVNLPRPLRIPSRGVSPAMSSMDTSLMSDDSRLDLKPVTSRGRKEETKKPKKLEKRPRSPRKWNFFHRSHPTVKAKDEVPVQVAVGNSAPKEAAVPHYAMLDSSDEQQEIDAVDLDEILRDADFIPLTDEQLDALQFGNYKDNLRRIEDLHLMTGTPPQDTAKEAISLSTVAPAFSTPEPAPITPEMPQTELHLTEETAPTRPSRLPQVGRIPKVVSARPQATSPKSFSRPFARLSTVHPFMQPCAIDKQSVAVGPSPQLSTRELHTEEDRQVSTVETDMSKESSGSSTSNTEGVSHRDFLIFPPGRKGSEATSSSGRLSFVGTSGTTAVIPEAGAELEEDEVWNEFDDLVEHDLEVPKSATSSCGVPFQYEGYESRRMRKSKLKAKESPIIASHPTLKVPLQEDTTGRRSEFTTSSDYSTDLGTKLKEALAPTPTSAISFGDFISGYGDRNNSVDDGTETKGSQDAENSVRLSVASSTHSDCTQFSDGEISPISQVNLRVGSMTVSKWLTFGHVLFSPARDEIMQLEASSKRHSILVIDGLGNGMSFLNSFQESS
jgi:hypothetical protein